MLCAGTAADSAFRRLRTPGCRKGKPLRCLGGDQWYIDSLAKLGVSHIEMPAAPEREWRNIWQLPRGKCKALKLSLSPREARLWARKGALRSEVWTAGANEHRGRWAS